MQTETCFKYAERSLYYATSITEGDCKEPSESEYRLYLVLGEGEHARLCKNLIIAICAAVGSLQSRLCDILAGVTFSHVFALSEDESLCQQAVLGFLPFGQSP